MFAGTNSQNPQKKSLYIIALKTTELATLQTHVHEWVGVADNDQHASILAMNSVKKNAPAVFDIAQRNGGFQVMWTHSFSEERLKRLFAPPQEIKPEQIIKEIVEVPEPEDPRNQFIKYLIGQQNLKLLEEKKADLNDYEYRYIKDQIKIANAGSR